MPLNHRQRRFVEEFLVDLNASAAAVRAGYSESTAEHMAARLMRRPAVAAAIAEGERDAAKLAGVRRVDVLRGLLKEAKEAKEAGARVRAWELLGKQLGLFVERLEVGVSLEALVMGANDEAPLPTTHPIIDVGPPAPLRPPAPRRQLPTLLLQQGDWRGAAKVRQSPWPPPPGPTAPDAEAVAPPAPIEPE